MWTHYLVVIVPHNLKKEHQEWASLWITGGKNDGKMPTATSIDMIIGSETATGTGLVVGVLF